MSTRPATTSPLVRAVVLAGGLGTRLSPVIGALPKAMARVGDRPFLEILIRQLVDMRVVSVTLAVGHAAQVIRNHFQDGEKLGIPIIYSEDGPSLRGTGGALAKACRLEDDGTDDFLLVLNGDTYLDYEARDLLVPLAASKARVVVAAVDVPNVARYGELQVSADGRVLAFKEKGFPKPGLINAGIYCARRSFWRESLPERDHYSLERDVLPLLVGHGLSAVVFEDRFIDIGVPEDYARAQTLLRSIP